MSDVSEVPGDILAQFTKQLADGDYDSQLNEFMVNQVVPVWQENSPVGLSGDDPHPGEYRDSVQVTRPAQGGVGQVGATVDYANIIEYGSQNNPEFAPRTKTETHFNRGRE